MVTMTSGPDAPPLAVLVGFGVAGAPVVLPGGKGSTWRVGDVVLKPSEGDAESRWRARVLAELPESPEFRLARPVPAVGGEWLVAGWEAWRVVVGEPDPSRIDEVLQAGTAFHAAISGLPRPEFLAARDDPHSYGDRVAWEELPIEGGPDTLALLEPLAGARRPVRAPAQVVHGDLPGNVLFAAGLPPAIIDWPPYWRPASWALAVAVVDGLCWYGVAPAVVDRWSHLPEWGQLLVRALIYRIATREAAWGPDGQAHEPNHAYQPAVDLALAAARRHPG